MPVICTHALTPDDVPVSPVEVEFPRQEFDPVPDCTYGEVLMQFQSVAVEVNNMDHRNIVLERYCVKYDVPIQPSYLDTVDDFYEK
jgi:hypothetical protein